MRDHDHPHGRPPWWPADEPFPPSREGWGRTGHTFRRRIAFAFVGFVVFLLLFGWAIGLLFGTWRASGEGRPFPGFFILVGLVVLAIVFVRRGVRRTAAPIAEVMEAASRVRDGDLSARAPERGAPDVRDLARSFNAMAQRLETDEARRRNLLADVTHELRTPLSVIRARVEGLRDGVYTSDEEHLALIEDETRVMARLLDDLQLLSHAEAGALRLHRERTSAAELVETAMNTYRAEASAAGVTLTSDVDPRAPELDVDPLRIGEVLANLLANAIRHTPIGGTIAVRARRDGERVAFEVADSGAGIAPDELERIFDRFAKSPESRGSGLGLAIARSLVLAHGGEISASNEPGGGAIFRFVLPAE
jgi:two-component system OmpR family sensor kinase/two-component system sensor histidine kinase BaeS